MICIGSIRDLKQDRRAKTRVTSNASFARHMSFQTTRRRSMQHWNNNAMQLAGGEKRGFVVIHYSSEALPLHRFLGAKQKDIRARLGQPQHVTDR